MGRHSAPDDEGAQEQRVVAVLDVATLLGRHAPGRPASTRVGSPDSDTAVLPVVEMAPPERAEPESPADQAGLALIEDALAAVPAADHPAEARASETVDEAHTAQIAPIVEPEPSVPEAPTAQIPLVEAPLAGEAAAEPAEAATPADAPPDSTPLPTGARAAWADLALIRAHGDVRARSLAAVVAPFVLYLVVLVLIGGLTPTTFLIWIGIPLVSAGILVGIVLDSAHKRYGTPVAAAVSGSADRP